MISHYSFRTAWSLKVELASFSKVSVTVVLVGKALYLGRPEFLSYYEYFHFWRFLYIGINILFSIL